jgi:uncharacterized protein
MRAVLRELALDHYPPFFRDWQFLAAIAFGLLFWFGLAWFAPNTRGLGFSFAALLSLCIAQPVIEEILFRGVIQGEFLRRPWGLAERFGISAANVATSIAFTALHFISHPPAWAASVLIPSLLFGYFRERHRSLYPPLTLHIYYNTGYFLTTGFPT